MVVYSGSFLFSWDGDERGGLPLPRPLVIWVLVRGGGGDPLADVVVARPREDRTWCSVVVM